MTCPTCHGTFSAQAVEAHPRSPRHHLAILRELALDAINSDRCPDALAALVVLAASVLPVFAIGALLYAVASAL